MPAVIVATKPATDSATIPHIRQWLNQSNYNNVEDDQFRRLIRDAENLYERWTKRRLLGQVLSLWYDEEEISEEITLIEATPLVSVDSVKTYDDDGTETVVSAAEYIVRAGEYPRIALVRGGRWPTAIRQHQGMLITCTVGHGLGLANYASQSGAQTQRVDQDDLTSSGTPTVAIRAYYEVEIDATGTPDTFRHREVTISDAFVKTFGSWTDGVAITGSDQALGANGTLIRFEETKGHELLDSWQVGVYEELPAFEFTIIQRIVDYRYKARAKGGIIEVTGGVVGMPHQLRDDLEEQRPNPWLYS